LLKFKNRELQESVVWYYEFQLYRKKRNHSLHLDISDFLVFPPKPFRISRWNHKLENVSKCSYCIINSTSIGLKLKRSSHKEFESFFTVSPKIFDIFCLKFRNWELSSSFLWFYEFHLYGKKPCLHMGSYDFLVLLPKRFVISSWNSKLENFSECSYGLINSISIGLNEA
jgi:hypothetical protein